MDKCPKCGAGKKSSEARKLTWNCNSAVFAFADMDVPVFTQSDRCRIAELEGENARLRAVLAAIEETKL